MPANSSRMAARSRAANQGRSNAAIRSRASKRPVSVLRSWPVACSIFSQASWICVTSCSARHWRAVSATTITRRPSPVSKSWPNAP